MEALKEFDIEELLKRQAVLDRKFDEKETIRKRTPGRTCVAFLTELGEYTTSKIPPINIEYMLTSKEEYFLVKYL